MSVTASRGTGRRPRLLVMNQYYWPGVEATAHLLSQLCEALSDEFEITVVTGMLWGVESEAGVSERNGVRIVRVKSTSYDRSKLAPRAINYLTYLAQSFRQALFADRPDAVVCMTDPPVIADIALVVARRFRVPVVVISQDVFPEIAVALKRLESPLLIGLLRVFVRFYLSRADRIVAIGETMRTRLVEKGAPADRVRVIPNWTDPTKIEPLPQDNAWSREHGFSGRFVVMHSGNVGHAQNLDALVRSTTFLRDLDGLDVAIIGTGARHDVLVTLAEALEADKVQFLPYQSREVLSQSLSAAAVHVVGLASGLAGYVVPSRLYGILAAARPVIVAAETRSETAQLVERVGCGIVVPPGRPELLAAAIRAAHDGKYDLDAMGRRGRDWVVAEGGRELAVARYRELLHEVTGSA